MNRIQEGHSPVTWGLHRFHWLSGFSGTPKDMGPAYGKRDPYYSLISLGIRTWEWYGSRLPFKGVPCPWGSLESPWNRLSSPRTYNPWRETEVMLGDIFLQQIYIYINYISLGIVLVIFSDDDDWGVQSPKRNA